MATIKGVWTDNGIILLENGKLNKRKQYSFFSLSKQAKRTSIQNGEIVEFIPWLKEGKDVAIDVFPTSRLHKEKKS